MEIFFSIAGWIGAVLILGAYFAVSTGRLPPKCRTYQMMNLVGAIGVGANVFVQEAWPALALQIAWLLIALNGLLKLKNLT